MVLPHLDLPIINPLIPLGSREVGSDYIVCCGFHSKRDFLLPFFIFIIFLIFPYIKNVLFNVSACNRNWKYRYCYVQQWQIHEAWSMYHMRKLRLNLLKKLLPVEVFLILWWTNSRSKYVCQDITLLAREQTSKKDWIRMERQWNGVYQ